MIKQYLCKKKGRPTYQLSFNPQIWFWHHCLSHASNTKVVQASKLIHGIDFKEVLRPVNKSYFSKFKSNNNLDANIDIFASINKVIKYNSKGVEKLYKAYIESKYTKIVKLKKITSIIRRLQKIHTNL